MQSSRNNNSNTGTNSNTNLLSFRSQLIMSPNGSKGAGRAHTPQNQQGPTVQLQKAAQSRKRKKPDQVGSTMAKQAAKPYYAGMPPSQKQMKATLPIQMGQSRMRPNQGTSSLIGAKTVVNSGAISARKSQRKVQYLSSKFRSPMISPRKRNVMPDEPKDNLEQMKLVQRERLKDRLLEIQKLRHFEEFRVDVDSNLDQDCDRKNQQKLLKSKNGGGQSRNLFPTTECSERQNLLRDSLCNIVSGGKGPAVTVASELGDIEGEEHRHQTSSIIESSEYGRYKPTGEGSTSSKILMSNYPTLNYSKDEYECSSIFPMQQTKQAPPSQRIQSPHCQQQQQSVLPQQQQWPNESSIFQQQNSNGQSHSLLIGQQQMSLFGGNQKPPKQPRRNHQHGGSLISVNTNSNHLATPQSTDQTSLQRFHEISTAQFEQISRMPASARNSRPQSRVLNKDLQTYYTNKKQRRVSSRLPKTTKQKKTGSVSTNQLLWVESLNSQLLPSKKPPTTVTKAHKKATPLPTGQPKQNLYPSIDFQQASAPVSRPHTTIEHYNSVGSDSQQEQPFGSRISSRSKSRNNSNIYERSFKPMGELHRQLSQEHERLLTQSSAAQPKQSLTKSRTNKLFRILTNELGASAKQCMKNTPASQIKPLNDLFQQQAPIVLSRNQVNINKRANSDPMSRIASALSQVSNNQNLNTIQGSGILPQPRNRVVKQKINTAESYQVMQGTLTVTGPHRTSSVRNQSPAAGNSNHAMGIATDQKMSKELQQSVMVDQKKIHKLRKHLIQTVQKPRMFTLSDKLISLKSIGKE